MSLSGKFLLAAAILLYLVSASFASKPIRDDGRCNDHSRRRCEYMPEGGSAAAYLLGAGLTCLGAMFVRSRSSRSNPS
jgi:hypothetical protein